MEVTFKFSTDQRVKHPDTGVDGKVDSLMVDKDGIQWVLLAHVNVDSEIRTNWIRERDLESIADEAGDL